MLLKIKNNLLFFQFKALAGFTEIHHGVFTRLNGFSRGQYNSLNMSYSVGDDEQAVRQNRSAVLRCLGGEELIFLKQVHQTGIQIITDGHDTQTRDGDSPIGDAMVTNRRGKGLAIKMADCQSIMMYDPQKKVIANVHSGWRGSVENIIGCTLESMESEFGCNPEHIIAGIGPSLGPCCAEFKNFQAEIPKRLHHYNMGNNHFNFWSISFDQLIKGGIKPQNIESAGICTKCNPHLFFSYRRANQTGRCIAVIGLT